MIYRLILGVRNFIYKRKTVARTEVPSVCIGNLTVGGTGKTPMTEMVLETYLSSEDWGGLNVAMLSRGYKRSSRGFQQLPANGQASFYGDEPMQVKRKFPKAVVAVDKDRVRGCEFLCHPDRLQEKRGRKCLEKDFPAADVIVLDDAYQYRKLKADVDIVLVDWHRPVTKDALLPFGHLRDLKDRLYDADVAVVTKCPYELDSFDKTEYAKVLGFMSFDSEACTAITPRGRTMTLLFTMTDYLPPKPVYNETNSHYIYSKKAILFTGIANDSPLKNFLSGTYKIVSHLPFSDHHSYSAADVREIVSSVRKNPTAVVMTTEKDAQRILGLRIIPDKLRERMFYVPIRHVFFTDTEKLIFRNILIHIKPCVSN